MLLSETIELPRRETATRGRTGYVVKVYPRYSETFIVTELLAREAAGERLTIFSLRPTTDARFQPQIAAVQAPVLHLPKPSKISEAGAIVAAAERVLPDLGRRLGELLPRLVTMDPTEVIQGVHLAKAAADAGIDHLHAHFASVQARVAWIAAHVLGIGYSVTTHAKDLFHVDVDPALLELVLRDADFAVAISDYNREHICRQFPDLAERVVVLRNGIDLDRFPFAAPADLGEVVKIAAVGRLTEKKGFGVLLEAIRHLVAGGFRCDVRIAGDGELRDVLAAAIEAAGLAGHVALLGPRSQAEVRELLAWADLMVVPSIVAADGNAEGLPTVLLEAMALGVPCIGSDLTGIPEVLGGTAADQTGVLVPPGDPAALARAIRAVAREDFPRREVAYRARRLIEGEFDTRTQARRLAALQAKTAGVPR